MQHPPSGEPPSNEVPLVAVFANDGAALAAVQATGAELMRLAAPGVVFLRPSQGLMERLYAAGAGIVVA